MYKEWSDPINMLSDNQAGKLLKAMYEYWTDGKQPDFNNDPALTMISSFIFSQFKRDEIAYEEKCQINKANGAKGGRPKNQSKPKETERFSEKPKKADEEEDEEEDDDDDNDYITSREKKRTVFIPPSVEEVRQYCTERGNTVDPEAFVAHYASNGWMVGKNKMKQWKAAVVTWERRQQNDEKKSEVKLYG